MKFQRVKGTRDFLPDDQYFRLHIAEIFRQVMESYGYLLVKTPALEYADALLMKSGQAMAEQTYTFKDKGGRDLGLRFDNTVPLTRIVATIGKSLPKPIKFCYIDNYWRYERPQLGRWRELFHAGAELFGSPFPEADAEIIACFIRCFEAVGLEEFKVHIGNRKVIAGFVENLGVSDTDVPSVIRVMDKKQKISEKQFKEELTRSGLPKERLDEVFALTELCGEPEYVLDQVRASFSHTNQIEKIETGVSELTVIMDLLGHYRVKDKCVIDFGLARGFDYYTGVNFECVYPNDIGIGSIGGGGRYDDLVSLYGGDDIPATGFSIGFDRVVALLEAEKKADKTKFVPHPIYHIVAMNEETYETAIRIAEQLRRQGTMVELDLVHRDRNKQLEYAQKRRAKKVIIVDKRTVNTGFITVVELPDRTAMEVPLQHFLLVEKWEHNA